MVLDGEQVLRRNRGGYGADIGVGAENAVVEFSEAHSCCGGTQDGPPGAKQSCGVGARAGVSDALPSARNPKTAFIRNAIARGNKNVNVCPAVPTGPT